MEGDQSNHGEDDPTSWIPITVGEVLAVIKGKGKGKGKSKGKGKGNIFDGKGGPIPMDVDGGAKGTGKNKCYECGEDMHFVRDCPIRKQRIAAGGPAILPNNPNGGGKGKGTWIPSGVQWKSMYPGPSPTMLQSWRPQTSQSMAAKGGGGKANL